MPQRVTNAEIATRLDSFIVSEGEKYDDLKSVIKAQNEKLDLFLSSMGELKVDVAVAKTERAAVIDEVKTLKGEVKTLDKRVKWTNGIEAFVALLLGFLGISK